MTRAGRGEGEHVGEFLLKGGVVALGVRKLGRLDPTLKKSDLLKLVADKSAELSLHGAPAAVDRSRCVRPSFLGHVHPRYTWKTAQARA